MHVQHRSLNLNTIFTCGNYLRYKNLLGEWLFKCDHYSRYESNKTNCVNAEIQYCILHTAIICEWVYHGTISLVYVIPYMNYVCMESIRTRKSVMQTTPHTKNRHMKSDACTYLSNKPELKGCCSHYLREHWLQHYSPARAWPHSNDPPYNSNNNYR